MKLALACVAGGAFAYLVGAIIVQYRVFPYPQVLAYKNKIKANENTYLKNRHYKVDTALYDVYNPQDCSIIMLGDSLTHRVDWSELLGVKVLNRGMDSDITDGYKHRLDQIIKIKPSKVFLNGGTNDLEVGFSVDYIVNNYNLIIDKLLENNIKVYYQSTFYTSMDNINTHIIELNKKMEAICKEKKIPFIDTNVKVSENHHLKDKYTVDGSHLNAQAYLLWKESIEDYILE